MNKETQTGNSSNSFPLFFTEDKTNTFFEFVEYPTLRKKPRKSCIHGCFGAFDGFYMTANRPESFCIFCCFNSIEGWTYRFIVIFTLA